MSLLADPAAGQAGNPAPGSQGNPLPATDWRTSLPEELRSEKAFESIKGKDWSEAGPTLAKSYLNAQRMVGADKLVIPGPHATSDEIAAFRTKLGVPAKPEEYSYKLPEGLTVDKLDKPRVDTWLKEMHEAGIPKAAADRLMSKFLAEEHGSIQSQLKARETELQQNELAIRSKYGDKFDENINYARWAVKEFGGNELVALLDKTGMGSHPAVVDTLAKIGRAIADDRARGGGQGPRASSDPSMMRPEDAQAAISSFHADPEKQKALLDRRHPNHENVKMERARLFKAAFPKNPDE